MTMPDMPELLVTLWPSLSHFTTFIDDKRLAGIRINSAMIGVDQLDGELQLLRQSRTAVPMYFDVKGRQPRIDEVFAYPDHLEVRLNHPISVRLPIEVMFKAERDIAILDRITEGGYRLIFRGGDPYYKVNVGESIHIRDRSFHIFTPPTLFTEKEIAKIEKVRAAGFKRYFLSYVECQRDIDQLLELVGHDAEIWLKIETKPGLRFVGTQFHKKDNLVLVAARGDLYIEVDRPDHMLAATRLIIDVDPDACVASRLLLSIVDGEVPSCVDLSELAWLYDLGYRRMMLCDDLCLNAEMLKIAINVFNSFCESYVEPMTHIQHIANM